MVVFLTCCCLLIKWSFLAVYVSCHCYNDDYSSTWFITVTKLFGHMKFFVISLFCFQVQIFNINITLMIDIYLCNIDTYHYHHHHRHHHHVPESLGMFPIPWSSKWCWSLHLFLCRPMFLRRFGLYFSACFGSLFVSILCTCCSHFSWYCFISFTTFHAPVFCLIHWFFSLSSFSCINIC